MGKNKKKRGLMTLNKEQEAAANSIMGIAAVIAVPGSGKTLTMTRRIGNLVQLYNVPPERILGLTFTRNAAEAMRPGTGLRRFGGSGNFDDHSFLLPFPVEV